MTDAMTPAPQNQSIAQGGVPAPDWGDQKVPDVDAQVLAEREAAAYLARNQRVDVQKYGLDNKARPSVPEDANRYMPPSESKAPKVEPEVKVAPAKVAKPVKKASPAKE